MDVLMVDDEQSFLDQAKLFLERIDDDLDVSTFTSPEDALEEIKEGEYHAVVCDYMMPTMDGLEFLRSLREDMKSDMPLIIFTGRGREEVAIKALNLGADRYLQKGGDPKSQYEVLAQTIKQESEHYLTKKSLQRKDELLRDIFRNSEEGFYIRERSGRITFVNQSFADIHGYRKEELIGMDSRELLTDGCRERVGGMEIEDLTGGIEVEIETKEGERRKVENLIFPLRDGKGEVKRVFGISRDITDKRRREEGLKESERLYETIFHDPDRYIAILDVDGTVLRANRTLLDSKFNSMEKIKGRHFSELLSGRGLVEFEEHVNKAGEGETVRFKADPPGDDRDEIDFFIQPVCDDDGEIEIFLVEGRV